MLRLFGKVPLEARTLVCLLAPLLFLFILSGHSLRAETDAQHAARMAGSAGRHMIIVKNLLASIQLERSFTVLRTNCFRTAPAPEDCTVLAHNVSNWRADVERQLGLFAESRRGEREVDAMLQAKSAEYRANVVTLENSYQDLRARADAGRLDPLEILDRYTAIILNFIGALDALVSRLAVSNPDFRNEVEVFVDLLMAAENSAKARGTTALYWSSGRADASRRRAEEYRGYVAGVHLYADRARRGLRDRADLLDLLDRAFAAATQANVFEFFDGILRNDTALMASRPLPPLPIFENCTTLVQGIKDVADAQSAHVLAASRVRDRSTVLVSVSLFVAVFSSTVLTTLLIASVRLTNRQLGRALCSSLETSKLLRKFLPTRFMALLGISPTMLHMLTVGRRTDVENVTIMFADLRGFTALSEANGDTIFDILLNYTKVVNPIVSGHGGFVDKWVGDGVLAVFPSADAAVYCAIELQGAVKKLNIDNSTLRSTISVRSPTPAALKKRVTIGRSEDGRGGGEEGEEGAETLLGHVNAPAPPALPVPKKAAPSSFVYRVAIGIHSGACVCGLLGDQGRVDGTIIGEAVNLASRLESLAGRLDAEILISEDTKDQLTAGQLLAMRSLGLATLPGLSRQVAVWEVYQSAGGTTRRLKDGAASATQGAFEDIAAGRFDDAGAKAQAIERVWINDPVVEAIASLAKAKTAFSRKDEVLV